MYKVFPGKQKGNRIIILLPSRRYEDNISRNYVKSHSSTFNRYDMDPAENDTFHKSSVVERLLVIAITCLPTCHLATIGMKHTEQTHERHLCSPLI
jgi:hypothetical protein